ncbi:phosphonate metabolism protein/1,5-bisphosphokinase (PRPP-forming) PhnN [Roseibium alexandrii DFL-11]|uniref:Ribose 1,5-bisphosphate phosphokinase PhnN n=2 Tax=Roseibium alexandrii TaxID=388408 RepID=A0A5E8GWK5_ROSAD|nr:phosphonate metabolism protein/1,5-bisphosphokinase (PRPP-forming) PhnN [Roseibium alexandrii DFL-11]
MCRLCAVSGAKAAVLPDARMHAQDKVGPGRMILVVGPSGAGKDTLMAALKDRVKDNDSVVFARRAVTRDADASSEDHETLSRSDFETLVSAGNVALSWEAHGLGYVVPQSYDRAIRDGKTVIANGSRKVLQEASDKYETAIVLLITAPVEILAERLAARGRESREDIEARLKRADLEPDNVDNLVRIENTGTPEEGVADMLCALGL